MFLPVAVIPVYNHDRHIAATVAALRRHGLAVVLVDDGSDAACARALEAVAREEAPAVTLVRHAHNRGKGAAVMTGLFAAEAAGFTHALQVDADGQHALEDVPAFLELARTNPTAFVSGQPVFDDTVPTARRYLRYLTHVMVSLNTLNRSLRDAMCGFRVYPIASATAIARRHALGERMDFDIEVFVRFDWEDVPIVLRPTGVRYPADGVSHFRLWSDNARLSLLHTRLFFGMLRRFPRLVRRRRVAA